MKTQSVGWSIRTDCDSPSSRGVPPENTFDWAYRANVMSSRYIFLRQAEEGQNNWTTRYLQEARENYKLSRANGNDALDSPNDELSYDGNTTWEKKPSGCWYVKYKEGQKDAIWMMRRDRNYVFRLEREGKLAELEPNLQIELPKLYEEIMHNRVRKAVIYDILRSYEIITPLIKIIFEFANEIPFADLSQSKINQQICEAKTYFEQKNLPHPI